MPQNQPSRIEVHRLFVEKFDQRYHSRKLITPTHIQRVENEIGIAFPDAYTQFLERYGAISTSIDMTLRYSGPYHPQLEGFSVFNHVIEVVRVGWHTVIPESIAGATGDVKGKVFDYLVPFAEAECGNYFCFQRITTASDDLPVYLFDHEAPSGSPNVELVAQSFDELLWWYVEHLAGRAKA